MKKPALRIEPWQHQRAAIDRVLARMPPNAPLRAIVASDAVQKTLTEYETADARAMTAQTRYHTWGRRGLLATTFGIVVGAVLLFPLDPLVAGTPRTIIGAFQTLALLVTFGVMLIVTVLKPLEHWMSFRAEAEQLRGRIFQAILDAAAPPGAAASDVVGEKLDLIMAAHIDDQLGFYKKRAVDHKRLASRFSPWRLVGYGLILCASLLGLAALVHALGITLPGLLATVANWLALPDANRWQLGIATMASAILAYATARTLMDEDARKAELYAVTEKKLQALVTRDLDNVKAAAKAGDDGPLRSFFLKARRILDQEHAVWSFVRNAEDPPDPVI